MSLCHTLPVAFSQALTSHFTKVSDFAWSRDSLRVWPRLLTPSAPVPSTTSASSISISHVTALLPTPRHVASCAAAGDSFLSDILSPRLHWHMRCCIPLQGVLWRAMCEFARETVEARQRNPDMLGLPSLAQAMWQVLVLSLIHI